MPTYQVNEIFDSVQGEGAVMIGRPSTFIRLQGCTVGCPWCDSGPLADKLELRTTNGLTKNTWGAGGTRMTVEEIVDQIHRNHVVITGGEPTMYNLDPLLEAIQLTKRHRVPTTQLETSGQNSWKGVLRTDYVTWSPKENLQFHAPNDLKMDVSEIKFVVDDHLVVGTVLRVVEDMAQIFWAAKSNLQAIVFMPEGCPPTQESVERTLNMIQLAAVADTTNLAPLFRFGDRLQYRIGMR